MIIDTTGLRVDRCYDCDLSVRRKCVVNGFGSVKSERIMFIGEAPGYTEDTYGIPFIGRSGELFNLYLDDVGLDRDHVYVTNTVKCLPRGGRAPFPHEIENCLPLLRSELKVLKPKIVILLGSIATQTYFQSPMLRVREIRNQPMEIKGRIVLSIFHPSYILRNKNDDRLREEYHKQFRNIARLYKELVDPLFILKY